MPPGSDRSPASGRRILSRIASPLTPSKSRHISDFAVKPDDEHRQYAPGDIVTGHVRLRIAKPIRVTHVVVCLHGYVQVYKNPGSPGEGKGPLGVNPASGRGKSSDHFGNGYASLFEDEVVLCGDGKLAEGAYQFNFELAFPSRSLPSSIDFERGTISYMITATLTRPNSISPPVTCDRKITFVERIDISPFYPPKARTITLAPLPKRSRKTATRKTPDLSEPLRSTSPVRSNSDTPRQSEGSSGTSTHAEQRSLASPQPSEVSLSSNSNRVQRESQPSPVPSDAARSYDTTTSAANKVITVTMESQVGGCLQGDYIPTRIEIVHTKPVRSLYGVIVTLFRQARLDMRPSAPLGPVEKGKGGKADEYYPKSVTGLSGLSLSGAGSSHTFRKDLSQTVRPLYVDPQDLMAEVHARVHVPDEAFPTINSVPGSMISFRYFVEVVVDIQGKLHGQEKGMGNLGNSGPGPTHLDQVDLGRERGAGQPLPSAMIDTAPIRRDKGVVTCTFEVIVGTKDSERKKGKRRVTETPAESESQELQGAAANTPSTSEPDTSSGWYSSDQYYHDSWYYGAYGYEDGAYGPPHSLLGQIYYPHPGPIYEYPPPAVPIPPPEDESRLTEKQRIQQAEMRLLPSQPPGMESEQSTGGAEPTAPFFPEANGDAFAQTGPSSVPDYAAVPPSSSHTTIRRTLLDEDSVSQHDTMAPRYEPPESSSGPAIGSIIQGDKQETRMHQLDGEASAPPPDTNELHETSNSDAQAWTPSAPTAEDLNELAPNAHDSHADASASTGLPRYER